MGTATHAGGIVVKFDTKTIGDFLSLSWPGAMQSALDASSGNDPSGWKEYIVGKKDAGEIEIKVRGSSNDNNAGDVNPMFWINLGKKANSSGSGGLEFIFPLGVGQSTPPRINCTAICVGDTGPTGGQDEVSERTLKFKLSGLPFFTAGA